MLDDSQFLPEVGADRGRMLKDPKTRAEYGLAKPPRSPRLEDTAALSRPARGAGWVRSDITVSTFPEQVPLAPGNKVSDTVVDGRRVARFTTDVPIRMPFSIMSAKYAEKHRKHGNVDLAVYYNPAHHWNVDRMLDALAMSLDYHQANFGPYQFDHVRLVESPDYLGFNQVFPGTIGLSETTGFIADFRSGVTFDALRAIIARQFAHQYWSYQMFGAETEGRALLSESLAQYSAFMVLKKEYTAEKMRWHLWEARGGYVAFRAEAGGREPPLIRVDDRDWLKTQKGGHVMHLIQQRLGEGPVNAALRTFLDQHRFKDAPYPRSVDLVTALRKVAKTEQDQALITDLFERVTLYDLKVSEPTATKRGDGKWDVKVPVEARKLYVDQKGAETEAPLSELIDVGIFTEHPVIDGFNESSVLLMERRNIRSGKQVLSFVTDKEPIFAGVDPYRYYIDRNAQDNVSAIK